MQRAIQCASSRAATITEALGLSDEKYFLGKKNPMMKIIKYIKYTIREKENIIIIICSDNI